MGTVMTLNESTVLIVVSDMVSTLDGKVLMMLPFLQVILMKYFLYCRGPQLCMLHASFSGYEYDIDILFLS